MGEVQGPVLITGGLGYVGGRIAVHLRERHPSLPIYLTTRACRPSADWATGFNVLEGDVLDSAFLSRVVEGVTTVIHLAGSNAAESTEDPARALEVTAEGTLRLLAACQRAGTITRFMYMSTFHVYGASNGVQIDERTLPAPTHPYAITHHTAEQFVSMFRARGAFETLVFRLSNCYGAPMDIGANCWSLAFSDLCRQAAENGRLALTSSGRPQRDFISIKDVARAVEHFLSLPSGSWEDGLFNLGGECSMSILQLSSRIADVYEATYGSSLPIVTGDGDSPDSWHAVHFGVGKLKATEFTPKHNLDEEILRTLTLCDSR